MGRRLWARLRRPLSLPSLHRSRRASVELSELHRNGRGRSSKTALETARATDQPVAGSEVEPEPVGESVRRIRLGLGHKEAFLHAERRGDVLREPAAAASPVVEYRHRKIAGVDGKGSRASSHESAERKVELVASPGEPLDETSAIGEVRSGGAAREPVRPGAEEELPIREPAGAPANESGRFTVHFRELDLGCGYEAARDRLEWLRLRLGEYAARDARDRQGRREQDCLAHFFVLSFLCRLTAAER